MTLVMLGKADEAMESLQMLSNDPILCRELPDLIGKVDNVIEALVGQRGQRARATESMGSTGKDAYWSGGVGPSSQPES